MTPPFGICVTYIHTLQSGHFRHVRWCGSLPKIAALFSHCVPAMFRPHRGHFCPGYGTIPMSHLPRAHHYPAGRGVGIATFISCQPTFGSDGQTAPRGHTQVFHPSNTGKYYLDAPIYLPPEYILTTYVYWSAVRLAALEEWCVDTIFSHTLHPLISEHGFVTPLSWAKDSRWAFIS